MRQVFILGAVALAIIFGGLSLGAAQDQDAPDPGSGGGCFASPVASPDASPEVSFEGTPVAVAGASPVASPGVSPFATPVASPEVVDTCATPEMGTPAS